MSTGQVNNQQVKRLHRYIVWTVIVLLAVSLSYLVASNKLVGKPSYKTLIALAAAVLLASVTLYKYGPGVRTATKTMQGWWMLAPLLAIISLASFSVLTVTPQGLDVKNLTSAGVIFVVVLAVVTVGGFLLTVTRLEEIHGRILSYPHLVERLDALIDLEEARVKQKGKKHSGRLYILANAPAVGNVSAPHEFEQLWPQLVALVIDPRVEVKLACLPWNKDIRGTSAIERFYNEHWGSLVTKSELNNKIGESVEIIEKVKRAASNHPDTQAKELFQLTVPEAPFHLFLTSERAILFTALSFPDYLSDQLENNGEAEREDREVKIIGFETGDRGILNALRKGFERRLHKIAVRENVADEKNLSGQTAYDKSCEIPSDGRSIAGLVRYAGDHWALICRGLTDSSLRRSGVDDLADVLAKRRWSSLRFDYGNDLNSSLSGSLRSTRSMAIDVSSAMHSLSEAIKKNPDVVIARGFGCRAALEALAMTSADVPLVMWAPILWLRTALEVRGRMHELRKNQHLLIDGTPISKEFVESLQDPTDDQIRQWIKPGHRYFIIHAEDDQVITLRFAVETRGLIESAGGVVEFITVLGAHPHPGMDVESQLRKISRILGDM